jgi:cysteine sulfinate desulfinase/cysteine desulfurase-like protein
MKTPAEWKELMDKTSSQPHPLIMADGDNKYQTLRATTEQVELMMGAAKQLPDHLEQIETKDIRITALETELRASLDRLYTVTG